MIEKIFTDSICRIAVPMFFTISGYWFYKKHENIDYRQYRCLLQKKLHTLVVPYFICSICTFVLFLLLELFIVKHLSDDSILNRSILQNITDILWAKRTPLWFVRSLFALFVISPLLVWVYKRVNTILCISVLFLFYVVLKTDWVISPYALLFFMLGFVIADNNKILNFKIDNNLYWVLSICFGLLIFGNLYYDIVYFKLPNDENIFESLLIPIGMFLLWQTTSITQILNKIPAEILSYSFMIYLIHVPIIAIIRPFLFKIMHVQNDLLLYFSTAIVTLFMCVVIIYTLQHTFPKIYNVISGSR